MAGYRPVDGAVIDSFLTWVNDLAGQGLTVRTVADVLGAGKVTPTARVTSPADGSTSATGTPDVSGTASRAATVQVSWWTGRYSTGTPLAQRTASVAPDGTWTVASPPLPNGAVTVQASGTTSGLTGTSLPVTFTVSGP
jgi:hypothetical protein